MVNKHSETQVKKILGVAGDNTSNGQIRADEFLPELRGKKAIRKYREMRDNDSTIGAVMYATEQVLRDVDLKVMPANDSAEAKKEAEKEFVTNQEIQKLKEEKEALQKAREEAEKQAAEKLAQLTSKVDDLTSSRGHIETQNPLSGSNSASTVGEAIDKMRDEEVDDIEAKSAEMFLSERIRRE